MRGESAVPVCRLSDRDMRIQFRLNSGSNAATNRPAELTVSSVSAARYASTSSGLMTSSLLRRSVGPKTLVEAALVVVLNTFIGGIGDDRSNLGLTERAAFIDSGPQVVDVPVQSGVVLVSPSASVSHPANVDPGSAAAMTVTVAVLAKFSSQSIPQLMPAGLDVIVPEPNPVFITFKTGSSAGWPNSTIPTRTPTTPGVNTYTRRFRTRPLKVVRIEHRL